MNRTTESSTKKKKYSLPSDDSRAVYVKENFNDISSHYDTFNDAITMGFHRLWKRSVVKSSGIEEKEGFLLVDLCSGTGDIAFQAARQSGPGSRIVALDFSPGMLSVLEERLSQSPPEVAEKLEVREADATDLSSIDSETIDSVTIGFGLRNVDNRQKTLSEVLRILKPGGVFVVLDVGQVTIPLVRQVHGLFFNHIVPQIGAFLQGKRHEMYEYLPASAQKYPDQKTLKRELYDVGFSHVTYQNFFLGSAALHRAIK